MITVYHNTRCTKSRSALQLLEEQHIPLKIRYYMDEPFTQKELSGVLKKLKMNPSDLLRKNETIYKELATGTPTEDEWLQLMLRHPQLIERPIVVNGRKAIVARPAEAALEIIP